MYLIAERVSERTPLRFGDVTLERSGIRLPSDRQSPRNTLKAGRKNCYCAHDATCSRDQIGVRGSDALAAVVALLRADVMPASRMAGPTHHE